MFFKVDQAHTTKKTIKLDNTPKESFVRNGEEMKQRGDRGMENETQ